MKKILPFTKELLFKTKISEITSISLEHTLNAKEDSIISGEFHINGEYKMTETSINKEPFDFIVPFDIALDSRFDIDNITFDIDDFYYEIINNEIIKINIDVLIDGAEVIQNEISKNEENELLRNIVSEEKEKEELIMNTNIIDDKKNSNERDLDNEEISITNTNINIDNSNNIDLLDNMSDNETYKTYKVYVVRENDTIEKILNKYNVLKEDLENYNEITELKTGDKIIIPSSNE